MYNKKKRVYIIVEAGINHNGCFKKAVELIDVAVGSRADAIKFQTFITEDCISKDTSLASYQKKNLNNEFDNQLDMAKQFELSFDQFKELNEICLKKKIDFLSTPYDFKSIDFLMSLNLHLWKIPSGEITNLPYLRKIGRLDQGVIMSTGMADLGEIESALFVLENAGTSRNKITILHCNTEYPSPMHDVNLKAMETIKLAFPGVNVGYSDHTEGIEVSIAAVAMGATIIEKHFTLDKKLPGPDHKASLEPDELDSMIRGIRNIEMALGDGIKRPSISESKNINIARKSIVASRSIAAGEKFTGENLTVKRPGTGLSPMRWDEVVGKIATKDYCKDELIDA